MISGHPEICLYKPEIPQNTGNVGRLCAAAQCRLHLVKPFAFSASDKNLRRPGLDYWPYLDLEIHDHIDDLLKRFDGQVAFLSTRGKRLYTEIPPSTKLLVFGQETKGLPPEIHERYADKMWRIPIFHDQVRSLNLANAVGIIMYHQIYERSRQ